MDVSLELVTELPWPKSLPPDAMVVEVFSAGWVFWDDPSNGSGFHALMGASHVHRHCRGSALQEGRTVSVSAASAAYAPQFASALGSCWLRA